MRSRRVDAGELYELAPLLRTRGPARARSATSTARPTTPAWCWRTCSTPRRAGARCCRVSTCAPPGPRGGHGHRPAAPAIGETGQPLDDPRPARWSTPPVPFSDAFRGGRRALRPTLGVHVVVDAAACPPAGAPSSSRSPRDGRVMFVLPAGPRTIVGTTDTDWPARTGRARRPRRRDPRPRRRRRLPARGGQPRLPAARRCGPEDVLSTFAGLRPLLASDAASPSATSREHAIWVDDRRRADRGRRQADHHAQHGRGGRRRVVELLRDRGLDRRSGPA